MKPLTALLLVALAGPSLAVPAGSPQKCATFCDVTNNFAYESGKSYVYEYSVATSTALLGTFDDDSQMHITASAHIDVSAPCEYILRLTNVDLIGSSHGPEFAAEVTKSPLRFSFHDGRVESLCSEVSEPSWVLNFKRGILSTFQNSMTHDGRQDIEETDISGVCMTHYNSVTEGNTITVDKTKDLASCSQRPDLRAFVPSSGYTTDSPVQSLPLFKSTSSCQQMVEEGILRTAECEETHVFRPFSSDEGGAVTTAKTTMNLVSQERFSSISEFDFKRTTLPFEQTTTTNTQAQVEATETLLRSLEAASQGDIRPEVPALFAKLVSSLRELRYPQLRAIYNNVKNTRAQKFLVDAMPLVETAAALSVVRDMLRNGDLTESEANVFFTSLAFIKNPTQDIITAISPIFEGTLSQEALLGTSALINTYCKIHEDCGENVSVQKIIRRFETELGSGCRSATETDKSNILVALKALGNAGRFVEADSILRRCYSENNAIEVRVAAIEAFRHVPCQYDRSHLLTFFQDESQDSEIRIAAYLALLKCPAPDLINIIKDRLTSEGVNQVGSFIWTHMTNMQESAAPEKQWVREMIGEELLQKKFNTDALKFSRNYESSFFMNELNVGAAVESNVIFSSQSYLPRSAMFNLTLDLFGQSINFFEVGGRIKGFEAYIERFFSPTGYYPEETIENILKNIRHESNNEATTLESFLDEKSDEPEGSYYMRMFGNELYYHRFLGLENLIQTSNPLQFLMDLVQKGEVDYTKSYQVMDAHHTVPTIAGLPVTLNAKGTATIGLKMNGNLKARNLRNVNIEGHLNPSAAVLIDGLMLVDAHLTHTGLKIASTLHTSTSLDGKLQINKGKLVDIAFNTPRDKMEVISVKTEFFYLEDGQEIQKEIEDVSKTEGCTSGFTGMAVCGELSFTRKSARSPGFPFTGPLETNVFLKKTDTHTGYIFQFSKVEDRFKIMFDTPGSQVDHKILVDIIRTGNQASFEIQTPFKSVLGSGEYSWRRNDKNIKVSLTVDGSGEYSLDAGLHTTKNDVIEFEPHFVLTSPSGRILNMQGAFTGKFDYSEAFVASKLDIEYSFFQNAKQSIHHSGLVQKNDDGESQTYSLHFKMDPSAYPSIVTEIDASSVISQRGFLDATGSLTAKIADFTTSFSGAFKETTNDQYEMKIKGAINSETAVFEATLQNESVPGKIKGNLNSSFRTTEQNLELNFGIYVDNDEASAEFTSRINEQKYSAKMKGTPNSFLVDANIINHILIDAHITSTAEAQKLLVNVEWDKDADPTKAFTIDGLFSLEEIHAIFKYGEKEVSAIGKLIDNGLVLEAKWAADKRIIANVHYTLGNTKSLATTIQTPFAGWEKQDAIFTFSIQDFEVNSRFIATWRNSQQIALTFSNKLELGVSANVLTTQVSFTSPFDSYERLTFSLVHTMEDSTIKTDVESTWNQHKMEGHFQLSTNVNGMYARATFASPFTEDVLGTFHHELANQQLSTVLEVKCGQEISTATIKGHLGFSDVHDVDLAFKAKTPLSIIPEIDANIKYTLNGGSLTFVTEGKINEKKMMFNVIGQIKSSDYLTDISGDLRFITPFTYPLTATLRHTYDMQHFVSQFEMTRIWSTHGSIKAHAEGHHNSKNITLNFNLNSPDTKAFASLNYNITGDNVLASTATVGVNEEIITFAVNGQLDAAQGLVDLHAEMKSSLNNLHDIKADIKTQRNGDTQVTNVVLTKDTRSFTFDHQLTFKDWLNWENYFDANGIYRFANKQTHVGSVYKHNLDYIWENQSLKFAGTLDEQFTQRSRSIVAQASLSSPWTEDMKLDFHHLDNGSEYKPTFIFEFMPGRKIQIDSVMKVESSTFYLESLLQTPTWDPIGFDLSITSQPKIAATFTVTKGSSKTTFDVTGTWESKRFDGQMRIESAYLQTPISVNLSYDLISADKFFHFIFTCEEKYEMKGTFSGNLKDAKWYLTTKLPLENVKHLTFSGEYQIGVMPFTARAAFLLNSETYQLEAKMNDNEIVFNTDLNGKIGNLIGNWSYENDNANIRIDFQSPFSLLNDMAVSGEWDSRNERKLILGFSYGPKKLNLSARMEGQTLFVDCSTPFTGWEKLEGSFFVSKSAANVFVSVNDCVIEAEGTFHLKKTKGKVNAIIKTPFTGYESITADLRYNLQGQTETVEFKSALGTSEHSLKIDVKTFNPLAPEMTLIINTSFEDIGTLGGEARFDLTEFVKTAELKAYHNDRQYLWQLATASESPLKGYAKVKVATPITEWTTMGAEAIFDFTSTPSKITFTYNKEGSEKTFEAQFIVGQHSITAEVVTPITNWKKLNFYGEFGSENDNFEGRFEVTKDTEKYIMETNIFFSAREPKIHIRVQTPTVYATSFEFTIKADLRYSEKKFHTMFRKDGITYSLDLINEQTLKTGYLKILGSSPIQGYTSVDIFAKYDFTGNVKTGEVNFNIEGNNKHFSANMQVNDNNITAFITTPFVGFDEVKVSGDYNYNNNKYSGFATFEGNSQKYGFQAEVDTMEKRVFVKIATPIPEIQNVVFNGKYETLDHGVQGSVSFQKNSQNFSFDTRLYLTPVKSEIHLSLATPVEGWRKMAMTIRYDIFSEKKIAEISVHKDSFNKKLYLEGNFSLWNGSIKIESPIQGFEVLSADYSLNVNAYYKTLTANVNFRHNSKHWTFVADGTYDANSISMKLQTPIEGFEVNSLEGSIDLHQKNGKGVIEFGSYKFVSEFTFSSNSMSLDITTPFNIIKIISLSAKYAWTTRQKNIMLNIKYNDNIYELSGSLQVSGRSSEISIQATTPFVGFQNLCARIRYDIDNKEELALAYLSANDQEFKFRVGGYIEEKMALFTYEFKTFSGLDDKFVAKIDLANEDKALEIILVRNGEVNAIIISGKLIGDTIDFNLRTPFSGLENLKLYGSMNRSKRSLDLMYMHDEAEVSLLTSFSSAKLHLKTPFEGTEEITFVISKMNDDTFMAEWKRNTNYLKVVFRDLGNDAYKVDLDGELYNWLGLILGNQSGEDKIKLSGSATFDVKGVVKLHLETPFENFKSIDVNFDYKLDRKTAKLDISSSGFTFLLNIDSAIEGHLKVPEEDTELTFSIGFFKGKVTLHSESFPINVYFDYNLSLEDVIMFDHTFKVDEKEFSKLDLAINILDKKAHLDALIHSREGHASLNIKWDSYKLLDFIFKTVLTENVSTIEKQFQLKIVGAGNLPNDGTLDITIENSFLKPESKCTAHVELANSGDRRKIKVEINSQPSKIYIFNVDYIADLYSPTHGDFNIDITIPESADEPWQHLSGNWDVQNQDAVQVTFKYGDVTYSATGKLTLEESDLILTTSDSAAENIFLQWHFKSEYSEADYFVKLGKESNYILAKLKGMFIDIDHVEFEGTFRVGFVMAHNFIFTSKWRNESNKLNSEGTFIYGEKSAEYHIDNIHYDTSTKSASFVGKFTSNLTGLETISVTGKYDFNEKCVIHGDITLNGQESKIDINFTELYPETSHNSLEFNLPILGLEHIQFIFSHDFSNSLNKSMTVIAKFAENESSAKISWKQSENFDTFEGLLEVNCTLLGKILTSASFDLNNTEDMHADVKYSRTQEAEETNVGAKWIWKSSSERFETNVNVDSSFSIFQHARVYAMVDYAENVHIDSGIEWNEDKMAFVADITKYELSITFTSPFDNFKLIEAKLSYDIVDNPKKVILKYKRGESEVNLELTAEKINDTEATLELALNTPLEVFKSVHISATIEGPKAKVEVQRNGDKYTVVGGVDFKEDESSVEMSFTAPDGRVIKIAASYDIEDFLSGTGTEVHKLASLDIQFQEIEAKFNLSGYRNNEKTIIDIQGESSFEQVKIIKLKIDTTLNTEAHDSNLEMQFNEFQFALKNYFEKENDVHYKVKSKIESTITPLPELILGFERDESEYSVTVGYGAEKEITFSIEGKNNFEAGFSGKVDIPVLGYNGIEYDIEYGFENDDELKLDIEIELGDDDKEVEAKFTYNAEGIKTRFNSLRTGEHSIRLRRSISPQEFVAEAVVDDYGIELRGGLSNENNARGAVVEGSIFGHKFIFDTLFKSDDVHSEIRLILVTPFHGMEKIGGRFTWSNFNNAVKGQAEIFTPLPSMQKVTGEITLELGLEIVGHIAVNLSGEEFSLKANLVGESLQEGYKGNVEIYTPFQAFAGVMLSGHFKMNGFKSLESDVKITTPSATHELSSQYTLTPEKMSGRLTLKSSMLSQELHTEFSFEKYSSNHIKFNVAINEILISIEANQFALKNFEGKILVKLGEQVHNLTGKVVISDDNLMTEFESQSSIFGGKQYLLIDFTAPDIHRRVLDVALSVSETHSLHFDLDMTSGLQTTVKVDSPLFPQTTASINLTSANALLYLSTPSGIHQIKMNWQFTQALPSEGLLNFELSSPLLGNTYSANLSFSYDRSIIIAKAELQFGNDRHFFEVKLSRTNTGVSSAFIMDTPYKNINKIVLNALVQFADDVTLHLVASHADEFNTLDVMLNKQERSLTAIANSPFIPTGEASIVAKLAGDVDKDMQVKIALATAEHSISGELTMKVNSLRYIEANMDVLTPFEGYKKLTFHALYREDDMKHILLYTNRPLNYRVELHFGETRDAVKGELSLVTPFGDFESMKAEFEIPLNAFAPRVSTRVYVNGSLYGGDFGLRVKAPYEATFGYQVADVAAGKFHLRTDSSFFSFLD